MCIALQSKDESSTERIDGKKKQNKTGGSAAHADFICVIPLPT